MATAQTKIYAPIAAKEILTQNGPLMKLSFRADKLQDFIKQHTNAQGYVNLGLSARREVSQYGETHSVWLDTWQPKGRADDATARQGFAAAKAAAQPQEPEENQDVPF